VRLAGYSVILFLLARQKSCVTQRRDVATAFSWFGALPLRLTALAFQTSLVCLTVGGDIKTPVIFPRAHLSSPLTKSAAAATDPCGHAPFGEALILTIYPLLWFQAIAPASRGIKAESARRGCSQ
jgi:hypothetical protein